MFVCGGPILEQIIHSTSSTVVGEAVEDPVHSRAVSDTVVCLSLSDIFDINTLRRRWDEKKEMGNEAHVMITLNLSGRFPSGNVTGSLN